MMSALTHVVTSQLSLSLYTSNPSTIKFKHNPLTQLTFLNLKRLTGGVCAEIRQPHIVLLFFQYFADLSFLIILGGVVSN